MELYSDKNKKTTVKGLKFKDEQAAKDTIKIVDTYFKDLKECQKVPGYTPKTLLPEKYIENNKDLKKYYSTQAMWRILAMRNRASSMLDRTNNEDSIENLKDAVYIFDKWLSKYKKMSGGSIVDCCKHKNRQKSI
uniref:Uncharacterized protein n=1 Tax=viral metagenome TaxID=1070528 RepID=A0A6C0LLW1_9ZZZZ